MGNPYLYNHENRKFYSMVGGVELKNEDITLIGQEIQSVLDLVFLNRDYVLVCSNSPYEKVKFLISIETTPKSGDFNKLFIFTIQEWVGSNSRKFASWIADKMFSRDPEYNGVIILG